MADAKNGFINKILYFFKEKAAHVNGFILTIYFYFLLAKNSNIINLPGGS